jgi:hypothetical protein
MLPLEDPSLPGTELGIVLAPPELEAVPELVGTTLPADGVPELVGTTLPADGVPVGFCVS